MYSLKEVEINVASWVKTYLLLILSLVVDCRVYPGVGYPLLDRPLWKHLQLCLGAGSSLS